MVQLYCIETKLDSSKSSTIQHHATHPTPQCVLSKTLCMPPNSTGIFSSEILSCTFKTQLTEFLEKLIRIYEADKTQVFDFLTFSIEENDGGYTNDLEFFLY